MQQHYPNALTNTDLDTLLQVPIFIADISWSDWRRYLAKPHKHIIEPAMNQFNQLIGLHSGSPLTTTGVGLERKCIGLQMQQSLDVVVCF